VVNPPTGDCSMTVTSLFNLLRQLRSRPAVHKRRYVGRPTEPVAASPARTSQPQMRNESEHTVISCVRREGCASIRRRVSRNAGVIVQRSPRGALGRGTPRATHAYKDAAVARISFLRPHLRRCGRDILIATDSLAHALTTEDRWAPNGIRQAVAVLPDRQARRARLA